MASMNKSPKKRFGLGDIIIFGIILIAIIFIFAGSCGGNKAKTIETKEEFYGYFFKNASDGAAVYNDLSQLDKDKLISAQDLQIERIYYYGATGRCGDRGLLSAHRRCHRPACTGLGYYGIRTGNGKNVV